MSVNFEDVSLFRLGEEDEVESLAAEIDEVLSAYENAPASNDIWTRDSLFSGHAVDIPAYSTGLYYDNGVTISTTPRGPQLFEIPLNLSPPGWVHALRPDEILAALPRRDLHPGQSVVTRFFVPETIDSTLASSVMVDVLLPWSGSYQSAMLNLTLTTFSGPRDIRSENVRLRESQEGIVRLMFDLQFLSNIEQGTLVGLSLTFQHFNENCYVHLIGAALRYTPFDRY